MASALVHVLTIDQTANGDNNNTASRDLGMGPIIDANGWYHLGPNQERFDIHITASAVTTGFTVQVYVALADGSEHAYGPATVISADGDYSIFQDDVTAQKIKLKMSARTDGTLNAEIHSI